MKDNRKVGSGSKVKSREGEMEVESEVMEQRGVKGRRHR